MKIESIKIEKLVFDPNNARKHDDKNLSAIKGSLQKFGQQKPIVIDAKGIVVAGNGTLAAAKELGWNEIQVVRTDLDDFNKAAFALADNRSAELAIWDDDILGKTLLALQNDGFDIGEIGFDHSEVLESKEGLTEDDVVPEVAQNIHGVNRGDIWQLGEHRLMCGDSTKKEDVNRLMARERAASCVTDPPYGIGFEYKDHDDSREKWFPLMDAIIPMVREIAKFVIIPCCGIDRLDWWYANHKPDWLMCWYKGSPGHLSKIGFNDWEAHLVWGKPPKQMHDFWQTRCGFEKEAAGHPCPKPVEYAQWLIERALEPTEINFEPFCGSGSTLIACEKTNRKCYGMEIDPHYCSVIIERWQKFTGKKALKTVGAQ